jgi:hypothetical protein
LSAALNDPWVGSFVTKPADLVANARVFCEVQMNVRRNEFVSEIKP